jgi:hypothetical protein
MICRSNVFFINNPDPNPELRLKPDPDQEKNGSTTLLGDTDMVYRIWGIDM